MVTHNEELLHNVAQKLIVFDRNEAKLFDGTYADFLQKRGWEDESGDIKAKSANGKRVFTKEELKKQRAFLIQEKSRILKPLEETIVSLERKIMQKEKELDENTKKLVQASIQKDVAFLAEGSKNDKLLKKEIEDLYLKLSNVTFDYERKSEIFRLKMTEIAQ